MSAGEPDPQIPPRPDRTPEEAQQEYDSQGLPQSEQPESTQSDAAQQESTESDTAQPDAADQAPSGEPEQAPGDSWADPVQPESSDRKSHV